MSIYFVGILCLLSLFFLSAPFWFPQTIALTKMNWFIFPKAFFLTGCSLLFGVASSFLPSKQFILFTERIIELFRAHRKFFLFLLVVTFLFAAYFVNRFALLSFMSSGDEHSCYFLAECIREGNFWAKPHPLPEFFEVVHVGDKEGKWFSVYPPGWPLLFALGLELNMRDWMNPILTVLALILFYQTGKKIFGEGISFLALLLMSFTPFFLFNSASYFSHSTCLTSLAVFMYAFVRWRDEKRDRWAILAAFGVGYGLTTRYLTMAAIAAPFLLYELGLLFLRRERWRSGHTYFSAALAGIIGFNLYYNYLITGNFFEAPNHYYHRWERLGFHSNYTFLDALGYILARLFFLLDWIPGGFVVLYFTALIIHQRNQSLRTLFRWGFFYAVIGYIFYYSWGGGQFGPRYYFEGTIFLFWAVAELLAEWWKRGINQLRNFTIGFVTVCLIVNGYSLASHVQAYRLITKERKALYDLAESTIQKPAVVFISGFLGKTLIMSEEDTIRNHPRLDGKILYAHDLGEKNKLLMDYYPNRIFYLGRYDREMNRPLLEPIMN